MKNLAIVAHVDHGKTTLMDQIFRQSLGEKLGKALEQERVLDSGELEKERGITIRAKNCAIEWKGTKINILDTPGHADFGAEVERSLMMVDGVLLLVDAAEGPLPQTRFVLSKALEQGLKIAVIINKIDRPDARVAEVQEETEDLLLDLASSLEESVDVDLDPTFFYGSGRDGTMSRDPEAPGENLQELLDFLKSDYFPDPQVNAGSGAQLLVTNLSYSPYLGTLMIGRVQRGEIALNQELTWCGSEGARKNFRASSVQVFEGLGEKKVERAQAGEIVLLSGHDGADIGDSVCSADQVEPLPRIQVDPPTVSVEVSVNTSPSSGTEGDYLTATALEEFLRTACRHNVALKYEATEDPKVFRLKGRGELQMAVVFEELRRQGKELMVGRPQVVFTEVEGQKQEPFERVTVDVPTEFTGAVTEALSQKKGVMDAMRPAGESRTRMEFIIPSRGLIGFRSDFLTMTKGEGLMSSQFLEYRPFSGKILGRANGAIVCDRPGKTTPYALFNLLSSGRQFVVPGETVYEGMIMGEHTRKNDLVVNAVREKHVSAVRTAGKDENIILPPVQPRSLDWALGWIDDDEWIEITPQNVRPRKKVLENNKRSVVR